MLQRLEEVGLEIDGLDIEDLSDVEGEDTAVDHHLLSQKVAELNKQYKTKDLVALEDHPNSVELIDGVSMNHGHLVLVVIQRLQRLNQFSSNLQKTKYYDKWSEENLDDVVSWRFKDE